MQHYVHQDFKRRKIIHQDHGTSDLGPGYPIVGHVSPKKPLKNPTDVPVQVYLGQKHV